MLRLEVDEFDDGEEFEEFEEPGPLEPPVDDGGGIGSIVGGLGDGVNSPPGGVSYLSDPWGNTFEMLRDAAAGLGGDVLPALTEATLPDLGADWFIGAYRVSFATAILVAVALLFPQFVRTARGRQSGRELVDSLGLYFGAFLLGATFGPAAGIMLVSFFVSLSDVFVSWGMQDSVDTVTERFQTMITGADPAEMAGGMPIAVLVMLGMLVGLFLVLLMLVMQFVTLYFAGVLIPLGLVWIIDPTRRSFGLRIIGLWVGILAAQPLLFFLLGFAFTMMDNATAAFGTAPGLQSLVELLVAVVALFAAALSPLLLLRLAPALPVLIGGSVAPQAMGGVIGAGNVSDAADRLGQRAPAAAAVAQRASRAEADVSVIGEQPRAVAAIGDAAAARSSGRGVLAEAETEPETGARVAVKRAPGSPRTPGRRPGPTTRGRDS